MALHQIGVFRPGAVRDVLALVRLLWLIEKHSAADARRLGALAEIGSVLAECLEMGVRLNPRRMGYTSLGYNAAVDRSRSATRRLLGMGWPSEVREILLLGESRVWGDEPRPFVDPREEKRTAARR